VSTDELDPTMLTFRELRWYERRSGSAVSFRISVLFVTEESRVHLVTFDTIGATNAYRERSVDLDAFRNSIDRKGRFEFRIEADSTNTTGIVRFDDIRLTVDALYDVSIRAEPPAFSPLFVGEEHLISLYAVNARTTPSEDLQIDISLLTDDHAGRVSRHIARISEIRAQDSVMIPYAFRAPHAGMFHVLARIDWPPDQDASNDTATFPVAVGYAPGSVVISEFMFAPQREDEPEWVELYIPGPTIIEASHLYLSDKGAQLTRISPDDLVIVPGEFALVASGGSLSEHYQLDGVRQLAAHFSSLNNTTPDAVVLRDAFGTTLDSVYYDPSWGSAGTSLERRDWILPSDDPASWLPSTSPLHGTPGRRNSVQRESIDGELEMLSASWSATESRIVITGRVVNAGRTALSGGSVILSYFDEFADATPTLFAELAVRPLASEERTSIRYDWEPAFAGTILIAAHLQVDSDLNSFNDSAQTLVKKPHTRADLLLNEIMFDPSPGACEWIEVLNTSDRKISLKDWTVKDLPTPSGYRTSIELTVPFSIPAGGVAIVAADSSLFGTYPWLRHAPYRERVLALQRPGGLGLNADHDGVVLLDHTGRTIDSILYDKEWHNPSVDEKGRSLERIRTDLPGTMQRAWTSAPGPDKASPARPNRALPPGGRSSSRFTIEPNPFSPDGDGHDDVTFISYAYPSATVFVRARLFDDTGREVRSLTNGALFPGRDMMIWDGSDQQGRRVRIGPYILFLEAWNSETSFSVTEKRVVVVAR